MANPSSSHHRERERERHHHHRTISSTTLLLVLSLILAVLAVMLSLPSRATVPVVPTAAAGAKVVDPAAEQPTGIWTYFTPPRSQALVAREHEVAQREAEIAKREAELLAGSIGGQPIPTVTTACAPCQTIIHAPPHATETIVKEIFKVDTIGAGRSAADVRLEDVYAREEKVSDREKEVAKREEIIGRRESDASRRENWIMEQLIALGNDPAPVSVETEEFVYDGPGRRKISPKPLIRAPPPSSQAETIIRTVTKENPAETIVVHPAPTRVAAKPAPEEFVRSPKVSLGSAPTTAVEVVIEETPVPSTVERTVTVVERPRASRLPRRSFWNW